MILERLKQFSEFESRVLVIHQTPWDFFHSSLHWLLSRRTAAHKLLMVSSLDYKISVSLHPAPPSSTSEVQWLHHWHSEEYFSLKRLFSFKFLNQANNNQNLLKVISKKTKINYWDFFPWPYGPPLSECSRWINEFLLLLNHSHFWVFKKTWILGWDLSKDVCFWLHMIWLLKKKDTICF